jgi:DNA-directed RNA polymerase subunit RPC12/RpoP
MVCKNFEESQPIGLEDGGHIFLTCSNCKSKLVDIWVTSPQIKAKFKYQANCPFCGDKSYIKEVEGGICYAGIYKQIDEDNDKPITLVESIEWGNINQFKVVKA